MGKRGPKATGDFASKGATLSARITTETRKRLDAAAKASGISLSQEVETRLRSSLDEQEMIGGHVTSWVLQSVAGGIRSIEAHTSRSWYEDAYTFDECLTFIDAWLKRMRPAGAGTAPEQKSGLAIPNPTPPSKIAVQAAVSGMLLLMAALKFKMAVPQMQAAATRALNKRIKLTENEQGEMEFWFQSLKNKSFTIKFGSEK